MYKCSVCINVVCNRWTTLRLQKMHKVQKMYTFKHLHNLKYYFIAIAVRFSTQIPPVYYANQIHDALEVSRSWLYIVVYKAYIYL